VQRLLILFPLLLLHACTSAPASAQDPMLRALVEPLVVLAGARVPEVSLPADAQADLSTVAIAAGDMSELQAILRDASAKIAPAVRGHVTDTLERFSKLELVTAEAAASSVIIDAVRVGFERGGYPRDSLALSVLLQVQWSRGGQVIVERPFSYRSSERPADAWDASAIAAALKAANAELGERIAEELFMPGGMARAVGGACGLQWIAPRRLYRPQLGASPAEWNRFILLDTLTPTLIWEPLTEHAWRAGAEAVAETAREVRYDLRLWQVLPGVVPLLVYERQGLTATEHTIEMPLRAGTKYFWSVRARFTAPDGSTRVTTWGRFRLPYAAVGAATGAGQGVVRDPCLLDFMTEPNYYRFATPAKQAE